MPCGSSCEEPGRVALARVLLWHQSGKLGAHSVPVFHAPLGAASALHASVASIPSGRVGHVVALPLGSGINPRFQRSHDSHLATLRLALDSTSLACRTHSIGAPAHPVKLYFQGGLFSVEGRFLPRPPASPPSRAISDRRSGLSRAARALPPFWPARFQRSRRAAHSRCSRQQPSQCVRPSVASSIPIA